MIRTTNSNVNKSLRLRKITNDLYVIEEKLNDYGLYHTWKGVFSLREAQNIVDNQAESEKMPRAA